MFNEKEIKKNLRNLSSEDIENAIKEISDENPDIAPQIVQIVQDYISNDNNKKQK